MTIIGWLGKLTPGFALAMAGSFQLVILPRKMLARTSGVNLISPLTPGNVVCGHDRAQHGRDMQDLDFGLRQLLVGHGAVAGSELDGLAQNLADAAAAADGLVVDLHVRMQLVVFAEPL